MTCLPPRPPVYSWVYRSSYSPWLVVSPSRSAAVKYSSIGSPPGWSSAPSEAFQADRQALRHASSDIGSVPLRLQAAM